MNLSWSERVRKPGKLTTTFWNRVFLKSVYKEQIHIKWISFSTNPELHNSQYLASAGIPLNRPVSIRKGKIPVRNCANKERSCLDNHVVTYFSVSKADLNKI